MWYKNVYMIQDETVNMEEITAYTHIKKQSLPQECLKWK